VNEVQKETTEGAPTNTQITAQPQGSSAPPATGAKTSITVTDGVEAAAAYIDVLGEIAFHKLNQWAVKDDGRKCAELFVAALKESVKPRDALEEMLVLQMAFTHARIARLSVIAIDQDRTKNVQVVNDACDRAANTFRRQMLALAEYRRPPRPQIFAPIRQANVAQLQQVQNVENRNLENENITNELGCVLPAAAPALPALDGGLGVPACVRAASAPVAEEHGSANDSRQGKVANERAQARRAQRRPGRRTPRDP
jgi:hypothetical protein